MLHLLCHESRLTDCLETYQEGDDILLLDQATILAAKPPVDHFSIRVIEAKRLGLKNCQLKIISDAQWVALSEKHSKSISWKSL